MCHSNLPSYSTLTVLTTSHWLFTDTTHFTTTQLDIYVTVQGLDYTAIGKTHLTSLFRQRQNLTIDRVNKQLTLSHVGRRIHHAWTSRRLSLPQRRSPSSQRSSPSTVKPSNDQITDQKLDWKNLGYGYQLDCNTTMDPNASKYVRQSLAHIWQRHLAIVSLYQLH